jgi:CelD/BcsL family acetyltransferase involved in cellulose biosynthesis
MLSIRVVENLEEFSSLKEYWRRLLSDSPSNNIFLTWEWASLWARHYLGKNRLFILLACEGDEILGIAPFFVRKVRYHGILSLRQVEFLGTGEVCSSYLDFIVRERNRRQVVQRVYDYLYTEARGSWDVLYLAEIPMESASIDHLYGRSGEEGRVIEMVHHTACPMIRLTSSPQDFLNGISSNERYNLRRKIRRLQMLGPAEYYRASLNGDVQKEMDTFIRLHQMRWEKLGLGGCFKSQRFLRFHREVSDVFSQQGWAHLDFLIVNGKKMAGIYGYTYNSRYYFYLPGLNPDLYPEVSPGILLLYHCIYQAIKEGCREFDLLRGPADYKMAWATDLRRSITLRLYNRSIKAAALKMAQAGKEMIKVLIR